MSFKQFLIECVKSYFAPLTWVWRKLFPKRLAVPEQTYEIVFTYSGTGIACRLCGMTSYNPNDVRERYCGNCHMFHNAVILARQQHHQGATHDCTEWYSPVGICVICGRLKLGNPA